VFEVGKGYAREGDRAREWWRLGFALAGASRGSWDRPSQSFDLDGAKGVVELIADRLRMSGLAWRAEADEPTFHPGRTARVSAEPEIQGIVGELHPGLLDDWDVRADRVLVAELAIAGLSAGQLTPVRASAPPRFPPIERDLAVIVSENRAVADVAHVIRSSGGDLLRELRLFDIYRGAPLGAGEKSVAHRLVFQADERTLTEAEIDALVVRIGEALARDVGGRLRS